MTNQEAIDMIRNDMKIHHDYLSGQYRKALNIAVNALLKEQTEIVRCKDCCYGEPTKNGAGNDCIKCNNDDLWLDGDLHLPDWFCADGENRESGNE